MLYARLFIIFIIAGITFFSSGVLLGISLAEDHSIIGPVAELFKSAIHFTVITYSGVAQAMPALLSFYDDNNRITDESNSQSEIYSDDSRKYRDRPIIGSQKTLLVSTCDPAPVGTPITSVVDFLGARGFSNSLDDRIKLAQKYGLEDYTGSLQDNQSLLDRFISDDGFNANRYIDNNGCYR